MEAYPNRGGVSDPNCENQKLRKTNFLPKVGFLFFSPLFYRCRENNGIQ